MYRWSVAKWWQLTTSGLGAWPHWAPVQGPSTPTGSPGGVTYLAKAKPVTEMIFPGYCIDLKLYFVTLFTFVSMPHHHIFLHAILRNVLWTICSADQFMHILTLSDVLWHTGSNYKQLLFSSDIWAGTSAMGICAFFYMSHWFGVVVFKRCMVHYWGSQWHSYNQKGIGGIGGSWRCRGHSGGVRNVLGGLAGTLHIQGPEGYGGIGAVWGYQGV